jgi:5-oxoprolinase (ATP-hydrolysing) subunit A
LPLLGLPASELQAAAAAAGIPFVAEAFADRGYTPAGRLVPRSEPDAVHTTEAAVVGQAVSIVRDREVRTPDGAVLPVEAASLCLHGDTPGAVALARAVRAALTDLGVTLVPFAG